MTLTRIEKKLEVVFDGEDEGDLTIVMGADLEGPWLKGGPGNMDLFCGACERLLVEGYGRAVAHQLHGPQDRLIIQCADCQSLNVIPVIPG